MGCKFNLYAVEKEKKNRIKRERRLKEREEEEMESLSRDMLRKLQQA